jgi:hypothetical protein
LGFVGAAFGKPYHGGHAVSAANVGNVEALHGAGRGVQGKGLAKGGKRGFVGIILRIKSWPDNC